MPGPGLTLRLLSSDAAIALAQLSLHGQSLNHARDWLARECRRLYRSDLPATIEGPAEVEEHAVAHGLKAEHADAIGFQVV